MSEYVHLIQHSWNHIATKSVSTFVMHFDFPLHEAYPSQLKEFKCLQNSGIITVMKDYWLTLENEILFMWQHLLFCHYHAEKC